MNKPILVVLAAGMGSRYGGLKQIDPVHKNGEIIIDYSIFDAIKAGFEKVVFIINPDFEQEFKEVVGGRFEKHIEVEYVFQAKQSFVPDEFKAIAGDRKKPWGTGHAILCCKDVVDRPFAIINADDFYGANGYKKIYDFLDGCDLDAQAMPFCMVGYKLINTVTEKGKVARGICNVQNRLLTSVVERVWIEKDGINAKFSEDGGKSFENISGETVVSMNLWGFTPKLFDELEKRFVKFLEKSKQNQDINSLEFFIPSVVSELLQEQKATVSVMETADVWYGVTYKEDKQSVENAINDMVDKGIYPDRLWG